MVYNYSDVPLQLVQEGCFEQSLIINPSEYKPFHWPNAARQKQVLIRFGKMPSDFSEWDWSSPIELSELGSVTVRCRKQQRTQNYLLVKINKKQVNGIIVAEIEKEKEEHPAYRIENYSRHFSLAYWQKGKEMEKDYLDTMAQAPFGWVDYRLPRVLQVKFFYGDLQDSPIEVVEKIVHEYSLDELDQRKEVRIKLTKKTGHLLYVSTVTDGYTKILKITDVQSAFDMTNIDDKVKYNYFLDVFLYMRSI